VGRTGFLILILISCGSALAQSPPALIFNVERFEVQGDNPLDSAATAAALEPFVGEYDGIDGLLAASDALESAFVAAGHNFHRVSLPPQELDRGVVILNVSTFAVGE
jgi:hemolysin activation/secretion protein